MGTWSTLLASAAMLSAAAGWAAPTPGPEAHEPPPATVRLVEPIPSPNVTFHRFLLVDVGVSVAATLEARSLPRHTFVLGNSTEGSWTFEVLTTHTLVPLAGAPSPVPVVGSSPTPSPAPAPSPAPTFPRDDGGRLPAWAPPEVLGIRRPLGLLQALRDLLDLLFALLRMGGLLLLYHRVSPSRALDHPLRARLHALVLERPGLHVAALAEALDAHPKTLAYHLRVLARSGMVRLAPEGRTLRVLPMARVEGPPPEASRTRERALGLLREGGTLTRDDLAALLGITPQAVSYHLDLLRRQGKVRVHWLGRRRRYEAAP